MSKICFSRGPCTHFLGGLAKSKEVEPPWTSPGIDAYVTFVNKIVNVDFLKQNVKKTLPFLYGTCCFRFNYGNIVFIVIIIFICNTLIKCSVYNINVKFFLYINVEMR